jgi:DNA-binding LytR/AlgR family response regulator
MKCIIIDDEPIARSGLMEYANQIDYIDLIGSCKNVEDAIQIADSQKVDLFFLDIQMPGMNGIDFLKLFKPKQLVIFTTAYPEFALLGYELDIIDYLLKPISFERFMKATDKALEYLLSHQNNNDNFVYIKTGNIIEKLIISDILFIESLSNYVKFYLNDKQVIHYASLNAIEVQFEKFGFIRSHRSYIINHHKIDKFEKNIIHIEKHKIPVSLSYKQNIIGILSNDT